MPMTTPEAATLLLAFALCLIAMAAVDEGVPAVRRLVDRALRWVRGW